MVLLDNEDKRIFIRWLVLMVIIIVVLFALTILLSPAVPQMPSTRAQDALQADSSAPMVVLPVRAVLSLPEGKYVLLVCPGKCVGLAKSGDNAVLTQVDGSSRCAVDGQDGEIRVVAAPAVIQRKALVHEVIHIAIGCDHRKADIDERIAEDVSTLYEDSKFKQFMIGGR